MFSRILPIGGLEKDKMWSIFVLFMFPAVLIKWIYMQKLAWIYMHCRRQRCKIDNFEFDISIYPNICIFWKSQNIFDNTNPPQKYQLVAH